MGPFVSPPPPPPRDWLSKVCACGLLGAVGRNKLEAGEGESWRREKPGDSLCFFPIETPGNFGRLPLGYPNERQAGIEAGGDGRNWREGQGCPVEDSRVSPLDKLRKVPHPPGRGSKKLQILRLPSWSTT